MTEYGHSFIDGNLICAIYSAVETWSTYAPRNDLNFDKRMFFISNSTHFKLSQSELYTLLTYFGRL